MSPSWSGVSPSREYLLREEYPDLKEKWEMYHDHKLTFLEVDEELKKFGIIKRFFNSKEYNHIRNNWVKAKTLYENELKEYQILEKLLWDY
ncbi:hypothetical protein LCGC14_1880110 [marine sediment metagenome]|uniref:Uncharacterized protein n=1 Tax=marine sediment metagenome TaxID=412755 RepID=A0A0F9G2I1_9ZZZZ